MDQEVLDLVRVVIAIVVELVGLKFIVQLLRNVDHNIAEKEGKNVFIINMRGNSDFLT